MNIFIIILAVLLGIVLAIGFGIARLLVKGARAARKALPQKLREESAFFNHHAVSDQARDLYNQAIAEAEALPEPGMFSLKAFGMALAPVLKKVQDAVEKAHCDRRAHSGDQITSAERHIEVVAGSIRHEFGSEPNLGLANRLVEDAQALLAGQQYDAAEAKANEAIAEANAEYQRARANKAGKPAGGDEPRQLPPAS